jgi:hypothetical protein
VFVIGLVRLRIALIGAAFVVLGGMACGIFDSVEWALIVTPVLPVVVVGLLARRGPVLRTVGAVIAIVAAAAIAVASTGGTFDDLADVFTAGPQRLLSTEWPSPVRSDLIGTVAAGLAFLASGAALVTTWRRWHLLPLSAVLVAYVGVVALSSPLGFRPLALVALCGIGIIFATLRADGTVHERWLLLRGERRLIGLIAIAGLLGVAISIPTSFATRADPRRDDPAQDTAVLLDPIEATGALRAIDPVIDLHEIAGAVGDGAGATLPGRWRTAALDEYDGRRWTPTLILRPIGGTLGPVAGPTVSAEITFLDDDLSLIPLAGSPVSVDAPVETDRDRTVVRLIERPVPGDSVGVVSNITPAVDSIPTGAIRPRPVDDTVAGLTGFAESLAGDGSLLEQLTAIEQTMRDDFVLESGAPAGGLQRRLIDRFLRDTKRGNTQQFATAFVLLARSLGADARVATGFIADDTTSQSPSSDSPQRLVLTSADASVWPEVALADGTWIAFDPVPEEESTDPTPQEPEPQVQTPVAPQPPIPPPPESDTDTETTEQQQTDVSSDVLSTAALWAGRITLAGAIVILPALVAVGLVLGVKYRRRRRRRRNSDPAIRIRGAWATTTDTLVDAGLTIPPSCTDNEIARRADPLAVTAQRELRRLAALNGAATYGSPNRPDLLAQDALQCSDAIDAAIGSSKTRWQRVRWRLSLRSLRSTTRSPVAV